MNPLIAPAPAWATSTGLLLVRLAVGSAFILHGLPKIQNPFGWMNAMGGDSAPPGILTELIGKQQTQACPKRNACAGNQHDFRNRQASLYHKHLL